MARLTIPSEQTYARFTVTGSTSAFSIGFSLFAKADLKVSVDDVELEQADFSFSGTLLDDGGYDGGTVTLNDAVEDCTVVIWRDIASVRTTNFAPSASVPVRTVDTALNRVAAQVQDLQRDMARAAKTPLGSTGGTAEDLIDSVIEQAEAAGEAAGTTAGATAATAALATKANVDLSDVSDANFGGKAFTATGGSRSRTPAERAAAVIRMKDYASGSSSVGDATTGITAALAAALSVSSPHKRIDLESGFFWYNGALELDDRRNVIIQGGGHWTTDGATQVYFSPDEGGDYGLRLSSAYGHSFSDLAFRMKTGAKALVEVHADNSPDFSGVGVSFERVTFNPIVSGSNGASVASLIVSNTKQPLIRQAFFSENGGRAGLQFGYQYGDFPSTLMNGLAFLGVVNQGYFIGCDVKVVNLAASIIEASQFAANSCLISSEADDCGSCLSIRANSWADEDDCSGATSGETVSITRSSGTATVTTSLPHRMLVGDKAFISGANQSEYNGLQTVTAIPSATSFEFAVSGSPATPATGTLTVRFGTPAIRTSLYAGTANVAGSGCLDIVANDIRDRLTGIHIVGGYGFDLRANNIGLRHNTAGVGDDVAALIIDSDADGVQVSVTNDFSRCWDNGNIAVDDQRTVLKDQFIFDGALATTTTLTVSASETWTNVVNGNTRRPLRGGKYRVTGRIALTASAAGGEYRGRITINDGTTTHEVDIDRISLVGGKPGSLAFDRAFLLPGNTAVAAVALQVWPETGTAGAGNGGSIHGTDARLGRCYLTLEELP